MPLLDPATALGLVDVTGGASRREVAGHCRATLGELEIAGPLLGDVTGTNRRKVAVHLRTAFGELEVPGSQLSDLRRGQRF
jgi:hypothetical protein